ncbi:Abi-alpha family protein [Pseudotamlana agarivorans]|uniref:Abi-alpha family protein n=1 Tax=Pseudotamlana agarivorans TaxID=481183 RepID=UPI00082DB4B8|nr:hypothetical protein [Tamlana agarivorans]
MSENKGLDLFGIKPIASAIDTTVKKSLEGIEGFLFLTCKPALGELGLMVQDKVRYWRLNNAIKMLEKAKGKLEFQSDKLELKSHPRIGLSIIENSSLIDNDFVLELWAGLFASSCTIDGQDDENLIFVDILKSLTTAQARIIQFAVENSRKVLYPNGLVTADGDLKVHADELKRITGVDNIHRIDRELDSLNYMGLLPSLSGGFDASGPDLIANICPTYLALSLYIRCQGSSLDPDIYWKDNLITEEEIKREREEIAKKEAEERRQEAEEKRKKANQTNQK